MTEKQALKQINLLFDAIDYGIKTHRITDTEGVAAFLNTGLMDLLAEVFHPGDKVKQDEFVAAADAIVKAHTGKK